MGWWHRWCTKNGVPSVRLDGPHPLPTWRTDHAPAPWPTGTPLHAPLDDPPLGRSSSALAVAAAAASAVAPAATPSGAASQVVCAFGYSIQVPARLARGRSRRLAADLRPLRPQHGLPRAPGADQACPPQIVGTADALLIEPLDGSAAATSGAVQADAGQPIPRGPAEADSQPDRPRGARCPRARDRDVRIVGGRGAWHAQRRRADRVRFAAHLGPDWPRRPRWPRRETRPRPARRLRRRPPRRRPSFLAKAPIGRGFDSLRIAVDVAAQCLEGVVGLRGGRRLPRRSQLGLSGLELGPDALVALDGGRPRVAGAAHLGRLTRRTTTARAATTARR